MPQAGDYSQEPEPQRLGHGPGYPHAAGYGPENPRMRPPATPPQFQRDTPPQQDPRPTPHYSYRPDPQPAFTPGYRQDPQPPRGQYPPPQPTWPQSPQPQYTPQPAPRPRKSPKSRKGVAFLGCGGLGALIVLIAILANPSSPSSSSPPAASQQQSAAAPAQPAVKAAAKAPAAETVTYVVTGSEADITYGPAGTELTGSVPMRISKPLGTPLYYSINAQLQGSGAVSCQILVNGTVISSSTADGGYNIAQCEIGQDPLSGQWEDDNG